MKDSKKLFIFLCLWLGYFGISWSEEIKKHVLAVTPTVEFTPITSIPVTVMKPITANNLKELIKNYSEKNRVVQGTDKFLKLKAGDNAYHCCPVKNAIKTIGFRE